MKAKEFKSLGTFIEIYDSYVKVREATKQGYAVAGGGDSINLEQPNSKTRRGRVGKQIANTLTCSCNQGVVENIKNKKGNEIMWKNELEKFEFDMEELKVFDAFAGVGALHDSLKRLGVPLKITNISEIDIDATITYAAYHIEGFKDLEFEYPSDDEMKQWLMDRNIGYSYEKGKSSVPRMKKDKLKLAYKASYLLNNLGDISKIDYDDIEDFDMMNLSFACTDLSNAGKQQGMVNEDGTPTRSGLVTYGIQAIKAKKPKYIMIENVKALVQKKFIGDFYSIINEIESYGYKCCYPTKEDKKGNVLPTCLNAKDYGIPQNRERIFVICIRNDIDNNIFEFPKGFDNGIRLKDVLEDLVDEKYYLSEEIQNRFTEFPKERMKGDDLEVLGTTAPNPYSDKGELIFDKCTSCWVYNKDKLISTLSARDYKQPKQILESIFPKNERQVKINGEIHYNPNNEYYKNVGSSTYLGYIGNEPKQATKVYGINSESTTLTALGGGQGGKTGLYHLGFAIRKLTPLECMRLMAFEDKIYYNAKELGVSDSSLYKQAGNSIVVNCLYYIFKQLFKKYIVK